MDSTARCRRRRGARGDSGAVAVEFALLVPVLLLLVFGIISYGYMLSFRQAMSQAASEGARAAAVTPDSTLASANAIAAVNDALGSYGVSCSDGGQLMHGSDSAGTCVVSSPRTCTSGTDLAQCVEVALAYTYRDDSLLPDIAFGFTLPETLSYSTEVQVS